LTMEQLWALWDTHFDARPNHHHRTWLEGRLAYKIQELAFGGLKSAVRRKLQEIGQTGITSWLAKLMGWISLISWVCFMLLNLGSSLTKFIDRGITFAVVMLCISCLAIFCVTRSSPEGPYAERIFKVLGFKKPKIVNLAPFCEQSLGIKTHHQGGSIQVYDLRAALKAYDSLSKATTPTAHTSQKP
jgi:hypothetical protein